MRTDNTCRDSDAPNQRPPMMMRQPLDRYAACLRALQLIRRGALTAAGACVSQTHTVCSTRS
jgi:hypothetical protein